MRNTVEFKRKISVLLVLAMLVSGQAGITVNAWAADVAGEYIEIQEESIPDDIVEAEELTDEQICKLLEAKWITPLVEQIAKLPVTLVEGLAERIKELSCKIKMKLFHSTCINPIFFKLRHFQNFRISFCANEI